MKNFCACILLAAGLPSCAIVMNAPGGQEDTSPPKIETVSVISGSTNFTSTKITCVLSENVDKNKFAENVFLSPDIPLNFDWDIFGTTVDITFGQELDSNTTYILTFGTDYSDLRNNKPTEAKTIVFATGVVLDSGQIRGKLETVNAKLPSSGLVAFLFSLPTTNIDTFNIVTAKPRYKTQIGSSGTFSFSALAKGLYRLVVIKDEAKNGMIDNQEDAFGTTTKDILITSDSMTLYTLQISSPIDKNPLSIYNCIARSKTRLEVIFNKSLDSSSISAATFLITDTLGTQSIDIKGAYSTIGNSKSVTILLDSNSTEKFSTDVMRLKVQTVSKTALRDKSGITLVDSAAHTFVQITTDPDTLRAYVVSTSIKDSTTMTSLRMNNTILFSSVVFDTASVSISVKNTKNKAISFVYEWQGNSLRIFSRDSLLSNTWYELQIRCNSSQLLNCTNRLDTLVLIRFKTLDTRDLGTIKGVLFDSTLSNNNAQYCIRLTDKNGNQTQTTIRKPGTFYFPNLLPGDYTLDAWCDSDLNGVYSSGTAVPFTFSERYIFRPEPLSVKPRWTLEDLRIALPR